MSRLSPISNKKPYSSEQTVNKPPHQLEESGAKAKAIRENISSGILESQERTQATSSIASRAIEHQQPLISGLTGAECDLELDIIFYDKALKEEYDTKGLGKINRLAKESGSFSLLCRFETYEDEKMMAQCQKLFFEDDKFSGKKQANYIKSIGLEVVNVPKDHPLFDPERERQQLMVRYSPQSKFDLVKDTPLFLLTGRVYNTEKKDEIESQYWKEVGTESYETLAVAGFEGKMGLAHCFNHTASSDKNFKDLGEGNMKALYLIAKNGFPYVLYLLSRDIEPGEELLFGDD